MSIVHDSQLAHPAQPAPGADRAPRVAQRARILTPLAVLLTLVTNVGAVTGLWLQHGGWPGSTSGVDVLTSIGQITALWGTLAALVQILLVARVPGLDGRFGMDRLVRWHRWTGFSLVWCLIAHVGASLAGWGIGDGRNIFQEFFDLNRNQTSVLLASIATVLLIVVAVSSVRIARQKMSRELWHFVHLLSYAMMALSFPHIVEVGSDFDHHRYTTYYWSAMYLFVIGALVWHRFGNPLRNARRHRFVLGAVVPEAPGVTSLRIDGDALHRFKLEAGQFITVRFMTRGWFHRAHPFSVSGVRDGSMRLTIRALGDDTTRIGGLDVGTKVIVEGPFGAFTEKARTQHKVLLIAGGIGITPIRLLFERMEAQAGDVTLLYRTSTTDNIVFRSELDSIAARRGHRVVYLTGTRADHVKAFSAEQLSSLVPDVAKHDVYLCGPSQLVTSATRGLRAAGVPRRHIHFEDFSL
jgi:predicted ferric reductase